MHRLRGRTGFTLLELLIVLVIGGILSAVTIRSFSVVHGSLGTNTAQSSFMTMHAQARALSVERGIPILLVVDPGTDLVTVEDGDGNVIQTRNFASDYDVSIGPGDSQVRLCFTPRGFADPRCGNVGGVTQVSFTRGGRTRTLEILPLGQAREA